MPGILCEHCTARCCHYVALPLDTPETRAEFDDVRRYLLHEGISVFVADGGWHICIATRCRHLQPDHRCGIHPARPRICRKHATDAGGYHSGDYGWEQPFTCAAQLDQYVRARFSKHRKAGNSRISRASKKKYQIRQVCESYDHSQNRDSYISYDSSGARPGRRAVGGLQGRCARRAAPTAARTPAGGPA